MEANRKISEKTKEIHKLEGQTQLQKVSESGQMTEDDIDLRNNSNLNRELGIFDHFRHFKRFMTMEFQEIKQQMTEITSDKNKQRVIHPTLTNNETFLDTKLTRKPGYMKQGTLAKDKERKKQKGRPFPLISKYRERDMVFQARPGAVIYREAVQQKKKVAIICDSMPKSVNLNDIKIKFGRNTIVYRNNFPGVNSVHMNHHIIPTLLEDKPDVVIVHVGINDVLNSFDQDKIIKNIQQVYITCKNFNVNQVKFPVRERIIQL